MTEEQNKIIAHKFVPEHIKLSDDEKQKVLEELGISLRKMPKILVTDAAIQHLEPKAGDVIKILRESPTAGKSTFYRRVING